MKQRYRFRFVVAIILASCALLWPSPPPYFRHAAGFRASFSAPNNAPPSASLYACARGATAASPPSAVGDCTAALDALVDTIDGSTRAGACRGAVSTAQSDLEWPASLGGSPGPSARVTHKFHRLGPLCGLPEFEREPDSPLPRCLLMGARHTVSIALNDADGVPRCAGGAYVEAHLNGANMCARPRVVDWGNGSLTMEIFVPDAPGLAGERVFLWARLLFHSFAGLTLGGDWIYQRPDELLIEPLEFELSRACGGEAEPLPPPPPLPSCRTIDFMAQPFWEGHWLRAPRGECTTGVCSGSAHEALHDTWVYRLPVCHFHFFSVAEARRCLNGSHVWGSGDSQWPDTERNLLAHVLGVDVEGWMVPSDWVVWGRSNDMDGALPPVRSETHPKAPVPLWPPAAFSHSSTVNGAEHAGPPGQPLVGAPAVGLDPDAPLAFTVGGIFNGAPDENDKYYGIASVYSGSWRGKHNVAFLNFAAAARQPDVLVFNSGLHDGKRFNGHAFALLDFASTLRVIAPFWETLRNASARGECAPRAIWRHNVAPAGDARIMPSNPQKMELYNRLVVAALLEGEDARTLSARDGALDNTCDHPLRTRARRWEFLDMFDMSWPWHSDASRSDGGHYGRYHCGHASYRCDLVDLMQIHVLLNGMCPAHDAAR